MNFVVMLLVSLSAFENIAKLSNCFIDILKTLLATNMTVQQFDHSTI